MKRKLLYRQLQNLSNPVLCIHSISRCRCCFCIVLRVDKIFLVFLACRENIRDYKSQLRRLGASFIQSKIPASEMERYFPPARTDLGFPFPLGHIARQDFILNKILTMKNHDEVAVLWAVSCFTQIII